MMVKVYSNPNCVQCEQTKKYLLRNEIAFESFNLADSPDALRLVDELGYRTAPIVVAGKDSWSGFRMDMLEQLVERHRGI